MDVVAAPRDVFIKTENLWRPKAATINLIFLFFSVYFILNYPLFAIPFKSIHLFLLLVTALVRELLVLI